MIQIGDILMNKTKLKPILKWAGGKKKLLPEIKARLPEWSGRYYEPFFGGGSVLFDLQPDKATISDTNWELVNLYMTIRDDTEGLIRSLKSHSNTKEHFYDVRAIDRSDGYELVSDVEKASRMLYLNKTCFNGLFRVNSKGQMNVPFGRYKNPKICDEKLIRAISDYFNSADIVFRNCDFDEVLAEAQAGDFVYLDPPYDPTSDTAYFTAYAKDGFNRGEQIRLKGCCDDLTKKGVKFLLSNSCTDFINDLYKGYDISVIEAPRSISCKGDGRKAVNEVLVKNY